MTDTKTYSLKVPTSFRQVYKGPGTDTDTTTYYDFAWSNTRTGGKLDDWKRRIKLAYSATTSLTGTESNTGYTPILFSNYYYNGSQGQTVYRYVYGNLSRINSIPNAAGVPISTADNRALTRFVKKARAAQTTFNGMTAVGELAETLRMIKNPAQGLRRGIDRYLDSVKKRSGKRRSSRRSTNRRQRVADNVRMAGETWLEFAFGWTPLLSDIDSGVKALAERHTEFARETKRIRAADQQESSSDTQLTTYLVGTLKYATRRVDIQHGEVIYLGAVKRQVKGNQVGWKQKTGFQLQDFIPTVWELIPYSFLIDYFTNVGDIVSSWAYHESNFAWKQKTTRKKRYTRDYVLADWKYAKALVEGNVGWKWYNHQFSSNVNFSMFDKDVDRQKHIGDLIPSLEFEIPGMGSKKWLNISALASTHRRALYAIRG